MTNSADPVQKPTDLDLHCLQIEEANWSGSTRLFEKAGYIQVQQDKG